MNMLERLPVDINYPKCNVPAAPLAVYCTNDYMPTIKRSYTAEINASSP